MTMTRHMLGMTRLMAPAKDDAGEGGGGGGEGGDKGGEGQGGGAASAVTDEMRKEISRVVNGTVKTYTARLKDDITSILDERLKTFQPSPGAGGSGTGSGHGGGGGSGTGGGGGAAEETPEMKKLKSEMATLQQRLQQADQERQQERDKALRTEERNELTSELRKVGIPEARIKGAVAYLLHEAGVIKRDESGGIIWPVKRDWGPENVPLAQGVAAWLETDEGKAYLPPKQAAGSGQTPGKPLKPGEKMTADQANAVLSSFLFGNG